MDFMQWFNQEQLLDMFLLPGCILTGSLIIGFTLNNMVEKRLHQHVAGIDENSLTYIVIRALRGVPISLSLVSGLYWIVDTSSLHPSVARLFSYVLFAVIVFTITRIAERVLSRLIEIKLSGRDDGAEQSSLLTIIFKAFIYATGVLIVLQYYEISITPIITALGVGGMAVALGLQETLANIFAGLQLILSRQLRVGEYVRLNTGDEGQVMDIHWRFTTIMPAAGGSEVVIPNKTIASAITTNFSRPQDDVAIMIPVGVSYDSDLDKVERITLEVATEIMKSIDDYKPQLNDENKDVNPMAPVVRFHTFGDSSIDFNVILHCSEFAHQFILKHEFIKALKKRYDEENIDIPFPIRTVIQENSYPQK